MLNLDLKNDQDFELIVIVPWAKKLEKLMLVTPMAADRFEHQINRDLDYFYLEVFDHDYLHSPIAHAPLNSSISFVDFETKFSPKIENKIRFEIIY